ncbi:MAG: cytochrome C oxidase assembly protein [Pseudomonadota bacterium]
MNEADFKERRRVNNLILGGILIGFVALVFLITVVKMMSGYSLEAFDHTVRPSLERQE